MEHLQPFQRWDMGKGPRLQVFNVVEMEIPDHDNNY